MESKKSLTSYTAPFCVEMTACLQECFEDMESGDPTRIARWNADPFWERSSGRADLTMADADKIIAALDEEYAKEIDKFPDYHFRRSGANAKPDWSRLPPSARLGLIQRLDRIADKYE